MGDIVRPKDHDRVLAVLERNLPPVTLLRGPRGVGKTAVAQWLAVFHGCGELDVMLGEGTAGMGDVRALQVFLETPALTGRRYVSLDLVDASDAVQNALLKIVEEPPAGAALVLRSVGGLLATLESRCLKFDMGPLSVETLVDVLQGERYSEESCLAVARAAEGSLYRARELLAAWEVRHRVATIVSMMDGGPEDVVLDGVPQDMRDVAEVCSVLTDVMAWYASGRVHPVLEDVPVTAPSREAASAMWRILVGGRSSRALLRQALWAVRA